MGRVILVPQKGRHFFSFAGLSFLQTLASVSRTWLHSPGKVVSHLDKVSAGIGQTVSRNGLKLLRCISGEKLVKETTGGR